MMFLFIFLVCLMTSFVICYTRCQTIVLNNRYIFDDLKKLGASPAFLSKEVRSQCSSVFKTPTLAGMSGMSLLFLLVLYGNDGRISDSEGIGFLICMLILLGVGALTYAVYRGTVKKMKEQLAI